MSDENKCPVCKSKWAIRQNDYPELLFCTECGSEWRENGEIILNAKTYDTSTMIKHFGVTWEDPVTADDGHVWARVCKKCVKKLGIPDSILDDGRCPGSLCDVLGCQNEQDYYIDF